MTDHERCWSIPLHYPPTILQMGVGVHGRVPVERYHLNLWCLHLYNYTGELRINGEGFPLRPGYVSIVPPQVTLEYFYQGPSMHVYAHFLLPEPTQDTPKIRAVQDLEKDFGVLHTQMELAVGSWSTRPQRAQARLWDILWQLTERQGASPLANTTFHPVVEKAINLIELRLGEPLYVSELASELGVSHNHLTRLFQSALDQTVVGYIQSRRVAHARHLLIYSTRSIKSIATEVGISDLHLFNKVIRRALGASPSQVRERFE